jgi:hypothetical protein
MLVVLASERSCCLYVVLQTMTEHFQIAGYPYNRIRCEFDAFPFQTEFVLSLDLGTQASLLLFTRNTLRPSAVYTEQMRNRECY